MLNIVKGDLLSVVEGVIAHGCNCKNGFGSGVAGAIAKKWPGVKDAYHQKFDKYGWRLGDVQMVRIDGEPVKEVGNNEFFAQKGRLIIANCATQFNYNPKTGPHLDYDALERCMIKVLRLCWEQMLPLAIPKIGCGLAGGNWETVQEIINRVNLDWKVPITVYEL